MCKYSVISVKVWAVFILCQNVKKNTKAIVHGFVINFHEQIRRISNVTTALATLTLSSLPPTIFDVSHANSPGILH